VEQGVSLYQSTIFVGGFSLWGRTNPKNVSRKNFMKRLEINEAGWPRQFDKVSKKTDQTRLTSRRRLATWVG